MFSSRFSSEVWFEDDGRELAFFKGEREHSNDTILRKGVQGDVQKIFSVDKVSLQREKENEYILLFERPSERVL